MGSLKIDFFIRAKSDYCLPLSLTVAVVETWLRWHWRVNILTQNLLILYVLLMLILRDVLTTVWSRFWRWILMFPKRSYFGERLYLPVRCVFSHVLFFWPSSGLERFRLNFPSSPILSIFPNAMPDTWKIFSSSLFSFFKHLWRENLCCMLTFIKML